MKTKYRIEKRPANWGKEVVDWKSGPAFCVNPRGQLIHRVRSVRTHMRNGVISHIAVHYNCGNGTCGDDSLLTNNPPSSRLLCHRCEAEAVSAGNKTASAIAGRHVHIGRMIPIRMCCKTGRN